MQTKMCRLVLGLLDLKLNTSMNATCAVGRPQVRRDSDRNCENVVEDDRLMEFGDLIHSSNVPYTGWKMFSCPLLCDPSHLIGGFQM